jgi:hypothetical protein
MGWLTIAAAVGLLIIGQDRLKILAEWFDRLSNTVYRAWLIIAVAFGLFLVYGVSCLLIPNYYFASTMDVALYATKIEYCCGARDRERPGRVIRQMPVNGGLNTENRRSYRGCDLQQQPVWNLV